jgi:hypothetical protein
MDKHDFSEFYMICGPAMESHMRQNIAFWCKPLGNNNEHITSCIKYLQGISDVTFEKIYFDLPIDLESYHKNKNEVHNNIFECSSRFSYIDYAAAYISNDVLLRRCLSISKVPLLNSLMILTPVDLNRYVNISLESCKLLHGYGCNLVDLIKVSDNYDVISLTIL